jgi:hypothetical protein
MARDVTGQSKAVPAASLLALALGAAAFGAVAIGALAIGRIAVGRLVIKKARFGALEVDELTVRSCAFLSMTLVACMSGATCGIKREAIDPGYRFRLRAPRFGGLEPSEARRASEGGSSLPLLATTTKLIAHERVKS